MVRAAFLRGGGLLLFVGIADGSIKPVILVKPAGGGCGPRWAFTGCKRVNSAVVGLVADLSSG